MLVNHDDDGYINFFSDVQEWYNGLSSSQLSSGFGTAAGAPPTFQTGTGEQTWANAYETWRNGLAGTDVTNGVYDSGDNRPPPPPPHG